MTPASDKTRKSLSRRIKQHVIGRPQDFYAITLPGLEPLCRSELAALDEVRAPDGVAEVARASNSPR